MLKKNQAVMLAALLFAGAASADDDTPYALFSFEDTSCGAWASSADEPFTRLQYTIWIRGYVSGFNSARPEQGVSIGNMPSSDTLELYIDKYCREKPLNDFTDTAYKLVRELGGQ